MGEIESKLEEWRRATEERGLKISRKMTEYLGCNDTLIPRHLRWRIGFGSHPQNADQLEELEECLSVGNMRMNQMEGIQFSGI